MAGVSSAIDRSLCGSLEGVVLIAFRKEGNPLLLDSLGAFHDRCSVTCAFGAVSKCGLVMAMGRLWPWLLLLHEHFTSPETRPRTTLNKAFLRQLMLYMCT